MPLLKYTTAIPAAKTVAEIQGNLAVHGAKAILIEYGDKGRVEAISFKIETPHGALGFRLPVNPEAVLKILAQQKVSRAYLTQAHANMVAWRIVKDWVAAQMAIIETEQVKMEQVFLPYLITPSGKTLYSAMVESKFLLREGQNG